jgi:hypothetical protein
MAAIQQSLAQAMRTVNKLLAGDTPDVIGELAMRDLARVEEWMALPRPLHTYSARSRRRFFAAAQRGYRPREAYKQEHAQRATSSMSKWGLTSTQYRVIHKLMNTIIDYGVDIEYYFDPPIIKNFATTYGYKYLVTVFTQQIDSIEAFIAGGYVKGPPQVGHTRWNDRGSIEARYNRDFAVSVYTVRGTDPFYYYHAAK